MSVPVRRGTAAHRSPTADADHRLCHQAATIRYEWLSHGLCTDRADRPAAERALTRIYARLGRPAPRVRWVDSPYQALPLLDGLPTLDDLYEQIRSPGRPSLGSDLATAVSGLRAALGADVAHRDPELSPVHRPGSNAPWPVLPAPAALDLGAPVGVVLHQAVRVALHRSLGTGLRHPVRTEPVPGSCHDEVRLRTGGFRYRDGWEPGTH